MEHPDAQIDQSQVVRCPDCKHFHAKWLDRLFRAEYSYQCHHPENFREPKVSPVSGAVSKGYFHSCGVARASKFCDTHGHAWEPAHAKHLFVYLKRI